MKIKNSVPLMLIGSLLIGLETHAAQVSSLWPVGYEFSDRQSEQVYATLNEQTGNFSDFGVTGNGLEFSPVNIRGRPFTAANGWQFDVHPTQNNPFTGKPFASLRSGVVYTAMKIWTDSYRVISHTAPWSAQLSCPTGQVGNITEQRQGMNITQTQGEPNSDVNYSANYVVLSTINTCRKPNTAPTISGASYDISLNEDESKTFTVSFTDPDATDKHYFDVVSNPPNGTVVSLSGGYKYTPKANFNGNDSFQIRVRDSAGGCQQLRP